MDDKNIASSKAFKTLLQRYVYLVTLFASNYAKEKADKKDVFAGWAEIQYQEEFRADFIAKRFKEEDGKVDFNSWMTVNYGMFDETELRDEFGEISKRIIEDRMKNGVSLEAMGFGKFMEKKGIFEN